MLSKARLVWLVNLVKLDVGLLNNVKNGGAF